MFMFFAAIASALMGAFSAYRTAQVNRAVYQAQSAVEANKAAVDEMKASDALNRGQQEAFKSGLQTSQIEGRQRAALAARGISLDEGSPLNILLDTKYMGGLDQATISDNAKKEAWALRTSADTATANANILSARAHAENPSMAALSGLISSSGSVANSWYSWKG